METMTVNSRKDFAQWAIARVQERLKFLQRFTSAALDGPAQPVPKIVKAIPCILSARLDNQLDWNARGGVRRRRFIHFCSKTLTVVQQSGFKLPGHQEARTGLSASDLSDTGLKKPQ